MLVRTPIACTPSRLLAGAHTQTLLCRFLPAGAPRLERAPGFARRSIELADGDELVAYHRPAGPTGPGGLGRDGDSAHARDSGREVLVHLYHGLGGSTAAGYVRSAAQALARAGFGVLAVNHRGCGPGAGRATLPYMTGCTQDALDVLAHARALAPDARHVLVGFSISGNTVLKLLAERASGIDAAIAVNPPVDLDRTSRRLLDWPARFYDLHILRACRRWIPELRGRGPDRPRYRVPALSSLREFDRAYITPVWGFASREEYYASASCGSGLRRIRTPTVVLAASDDPIVPGGEVRDACRGTSVHVHLEPRGGHMGYFTRERTPLGTRRWLDYAIVHYARALLEAAAPRTVLEHMPDLHPCARP